MSLSGAATAFSYAQAAKGLAPSIQATSTVPSSASSENGSKDVAAETTELPRRIKSHSQNKEETASPAEKELYAEEASSSQATLPTHQEVVASTTTAPTQPDETTTMVATETPKSPEPSTERPDALSSGDQSLSSPGVDQIVPNGEADTGKEAEDDWERVSVPSNTAEKELKAAPLPSVNIWQQRKEAQEAKAKENPTSRAAGTVTAARQRGRIAGSVDDSRRQSNPRDTVGEKDPAQAVRRVNSGSHAVSERKESNTASQSPRSSSKQGRPDKATVAPPSPADTSSWPTPDTTPSNERRQSVLSEKPEKLEKPESKAGSQKKAWIQMPFVPTAKFDTPLPPAAAARRGGRLGNRGRDSGGNRGGLNIQAGHAGSKPEAGLMGPPPPPNKTSDFERGRRSDTSRGNRASSVPTHAQSTRTPSQGDSSTGANRLPATNASRATSDAKPADVQHVLDPEVKEFNDQTEEISRSSSRKAVRPPPNTGRKGDTDRQETSTSPSHRGAPQSDGLSRQTSQAERYRTSPYEGHRNSASNIDRSQNQNRDWSRGRIDPGREKTDSWRGSREGRPDRGRGSYRGRGNHAGFSPHGQSHGFVTPLGNSGTPETSKSMSAHDSRSRQASQPFASASNVNGGRSNPRSQSIPLAMMQQGYYSPIQGFPQTMSPTDMNFGAYPQPMQNGTIMSAMPYNEQLSSYALISMIVTQLEYYFSIDNLCKDMFLRKNMDSQGFVFLTVIAGFKRIQTLMENNISYEQLQSICQQVRNIDFVIGNDGKDRLRSRDNWRDFVLPMEDRVQDAQNDGTILRPQAQQMPSLTTSNYAMPNGSMRSPATNLNGYAEPFVQPMPYSPMSAYDGVTDYNVGHADAYGYDPTRRTSTVSPFNNAQTPPSADTARSPPSNKINGRQASISTNAPDENVFPDEKIPELKVVVRDPAFEAATSNGNGTEGQNGTGLRGGASSPLQLDQFRSLHSDRNTTSSSWSPAGQEQPSFWTKDGEIAKVPVGPGFVHEDYTTLHDKAINQRTEHHFDGALPVLYAFWASFLVGNFNVSMYQEFVELATEDVRAGSNDGKTHLLNYFDSVLTSKTPMMECIAKDIVALAREETGDCRPTFQKLRSAWRNGATNLKTRKRLGDILSIEEKTELDRGV